MKKDKKDVFDVDMIICGERSRHMLDFPIAGMRYWNAAEVLGSLKVGNKVKLVLEPDNSYDANAVAIYRKGCKLGYIPRCCNADIAQLIYFGHRDILEARVIAIDLSKSISEQVRVGIYMK